VANARKSPRIWDYIKSINQTKDRSVLADVDFDKTYQPWLVNRSLSQHADSVLAANMMNERPDIPPQAQFLFLLNILRARFRRSDWLKSSTSDDVRAIAEYYGCSVRHARDLVSLHSSGQLTTIHARLDKGGMGTNKGPSHDST